MRHLVGMTEQEVIKHLKSDSTQDWLMTKFENHYREDIDRVINAKPGLELDEALRDLDEAILDSLCSDADWEFKDIGFEYPELCGLGELPDPKTDPVFNVLYDTAKKIRRWVLEDREKVNPSRLFGQ